MKKIFSFIVILAIASASVIWAEQLKQYQTFNWTKVEKASKYGVEVEQKENGGKWSSVVSEKTTECNLEVLLYPGEYRVSITTYNVLGKKASSTDWVEFTILDESEPFIFENAFTASKKYDVPVMNFKLEDDYIVYSSENTVSAIDDYIDNSFFLTGKNFFFPETKFYLLPKAKSVNGLQGEPFVEGRIKSELSILRRDRERNGIYLSYATEELYTGYYDLVIENPGNNKCSKEILVIAERNPLLEADEAKFNKRYLAVDAVVERSDNAVFNIKGSGFNAGTQFTFVPVTDGAVFPFASSLPRSTVNASVADGKVTYANGVLNATLSFSSREMQTGYYNLTATNADGTSCSEKLLVTVKEIAEVVPEITEITSKQKKNDLEITISGLRFVPDTKLTLVGEVVEGSGLNKKIPVAIKEIKKDGKKIEAAADVTNLKAGTYALLVESKTASLVSYISIDSSFKTSLNNLSESEIASSFFRAEQKDAVVQNVTSGSKTTAAAVLSSSSSSSFIPSADAGWISLYEGTNVINEYQFFGCNSIGILMIPETVYSIKDYAFSNWEKNQTIILNWNPDDGTIHVINNYAFANCKATIRYKNGTLYSAKYVDYEPVAKDFSDNSNLEVPSDVDMWKKFFNIENGVLRITSDVAWEYKNYWRKENNFSKVIVEDGVTYVGKEAFAGCSCITEIVLSPNVRVISDYAFKDCVNLVKITMASSANDPSISVALKQSDILKPSDGTFYGCKSLKQIEYVDGKYTVGREEVVFRIPKVAKYTNRLILPYVEAALVLPDVALLVSDIVTVNMDLTFDILNFRDIIALQFDALGPCTDMVYSPELKTQYSSKNFFKLGGKIKLGIPGTVIHPYVSAGFYKPVEINGFTENSSIDRGLLPETYYPFEAGFMLGNVFDIKYSVSLAEYPHSVDYPDGNYAFDVLAESVSIGLRFPLGKKVNVGYNTSKMARLFVNDVCDEVSFKYDSEKSEYNAVIDATESIGVITAKKTDVTLQWMFVSNMDIDELKVYLVDTSEKAGGWSVLTNKKYLLVENIKAGVPTEINYDVTTDVKAKENVSLYFTYALDAAQGEAVLKTINQ